MQKIEGCVRRSTSRVLLGFFVAPGAPALILYVINLALVSRQAALLQGVILAILGYAAASVLGIPVYYLMKKKKAFSLSSYLAAGTLVGLLFYVLYFGLWGLVSYQSYPEHAIALIRNSLMAGVVAVGYAAVASGLFWLIAIRELRS
jgi:hypothetical protein